MNHSVIVVIFMPLNCRLGFVRYNLVWPSVKSIFSLSLLSAILSEMIFCIFFKFTKIISPCNYAILILNWSKKTIILLSFCYTMKICPNCESFHCFLIYHFSYLKFENIISEKSNLNHPQTHRHDTIIIFYKFCKVKSFHRICLSPNRSYHFESLSCPKLTKTFDRSPPNVEKSF